MGFATDGMKAWPCKRPMGLSLGRPPALQLRTNHTVVPKRTVLRTTRAPDIRATPFPRPLWWEEDKGKGGNDASTQSYSAAQPPVGVCTNIPTRVKPIKRGSTESANTPTGHSLGHGFVPTTGGVSAESAENIPFEYLKTHFVARRGPTRPANEISTRYSPGHVAGHDHDKAMPTAAARQNLPDYRVPCATQPSRTQHTQQHRTYHWWQ